jgi:hypothetical protein
VIKGPLENIWREGLKGDDHDDYFFGAITFFPVQSREFPLLSDFITFAKGVE